MAIITRKDGVKFLTQVYRERIGITNRRLLVQEIRMLSSQHGPYISIMRKIKRELEVAFGSEPGYLLGELVWDYFGRPDNLIFCEAINESAQCILVVIRNASVYLDRRLLSSEVHDELIPICADTIQYDVYTYGDVAIRDVDTFGDATFKLPKQLVAKFNHLKASIVDKLAPSPEFELKPLPTILRSRYLRNRIPVLIACAALSAVVGGWWYFSANSGALGPAVPLAQAPHQIQNYEIALSSPRPSAIFDELAKKIDQLYLIPGWYAARITFSGDKYHVGMRSQGGDLWYLTDWAKQHYYDLRITTDGAELTLESHLQKRRLPGRYPAMQLVVGTLMTRIEHVLKVDAIHVDSTHQRGTMQETKFTLNLKQLSPDLLDLVGQELEDLPLSLSSIDLQLKDGLIDGTVQLSVWGR